MASACLLRSSRKLPSSLLIFIRRVHVEQAPIESLPVSTDVSELVKTVPKIHGTGPFALAPQFKVIGSPATMLSVSLPASSTIYTRRGSLIGVTGKAENITSTLSAQNLFRKAIVGIPFLYNKISSISPLNLLISSRSPFLTSFAVVTLDGRVDWQVCQRDALIAWAGDTLNVHPRLNTKWALSNWGSSRVSGRGEIALSGRGQIYQIVLNDGDETLIHPKNIVAFALSSPISAQPIRLKHSSIRLQVPTNFLSWPNNTKPEFISNITKSRVYKTITSILNGIKKFTRRIIWGDDIYIKISGPTTLLVSSRAAKPTDIISSHEVADHAAGTRLVTIPSSSSTGTKSDKDQVPSKSSSSTTTTTKHPENQSGLGYIKIATVKDGKVTFESTDNFKQFTH